MKPKIGDKFKIKPNIWARDHDAHYSKWTPKEWNNPNVILIVVKDPEQAHLVSVVPFGTDPMQYYGHSLSELVPYKKLTIII